MGERKNSPRSLKPWLSYQNQLKLLKQRSLQVENDIAALDYLKRIGYYRLSGYWYPLREIDQAASTEKGEPLRHDHFLPGSRFEDIVKLYVFDKKLRLMALDAIERIEMAVRVDIAHLLGQKDPLAHEKPEYLHKNFVMKNKKKDHGNGKSNYEIWKEKYQTLIKRSNRQSFIRHHLQEYGALPVWVAIEIWDFGLLSQLYAGMQHGDKETIAKHYGASDGKTFGSWLRSLNFIRNIAAHHGRLWNINVLDRSKIPNGWSYKHNNARPFFYFCLMAQLLVSICPNSSWSKRFEDLLTEFPFPDGRPISLADMGVYEGWFGDKPWK